MSRWSFVGGWWVGEGPVNESVVSVGATLAGGSVFVGRWVSGVLVGSWLAGGRPAAGLVVGGQGPSVVGIFVIRPPGIFLNNHKKPYIHSI